MPLVRHMSERQTSLVNLRGLLIHLIRLHMASHSCHPQQTGEILPLIQSPAFNLFECRPPDHLHLGPVAEQDYSLPVLVAATKNTWFSDFCRRGFLRENSCRVGWKTEWSYYRLCPHPVVKPATSYKNIFSTLPLWLIASNVRLHKSGSYVGNVHVG